MSFPALDFHGAPAPGILKGDLNLWFQEKKKRISTLELQNKNFGNIIFL